MEQAICYFRTFGFLLSVFFAAVLATFSQAPAGDTSAKPAAIKFAELTEINPCEFRVEARRFVEQLRKDNNEGYIINYASTASRPSYFDSVDGREREFMKAINDRYHNPRMVLLRGGYRSQATTEFWIVPPRAEDPQPSGDAAPPSSPFVEEPVPYDEKSFEYYRGERVLGKFVLDSVRSAEKAAGIGDPEPFDAGLDVVWHDWRDELEFKWADVGIAKRLANTKGTTGVMLFYADDQRYDIQKLTKFVEEGRDLLVRDARIEKSRLAVRYGGYRDDASVEYWVLGPNDTSPQIRANERCPDANKANE